MADEESVAAVDDEVAFAKWLEGLQSEEDEAEEPEETEEEPDALEVAQQTKKRLEEMEQEKKVEALVDKFMETAPDDAKRLFGIWRTGKEDTKQLKGLMELAAVKARETVPSDESAEEKAKKIAREQYGVGPISPGVASEKSEDELWEEARQRVRRGDMHQAYKMWESLPATGGVTTEE
jgi:hypothetical protein